MKLLTTILMIGSLASGQGAPRNRTIQDRKTFEQKAQQRTISAEISRAISAKQEFQFPIEPVPAGVKATAKAASMTDDGYVLRLFTVELDGVDGTRLKADQVTYFWGTQEFTILNGSRVLP